MTQTINATVGLRPLVIMTYANSGAGKTTDALYSFSNGLFIASRGALLPAEHVCGYKPAEIEATTIQDATQKLLELNNSGAQYDAVIVDDFSYLAEKTFTLIEQKYKRSSNNFAKFGELASVALKFRDTARHMNCHVVLNCWEKPPGTRNGQAVKGGPMLTGKLTESIPALCDVVYRCGFEPMRKPWAGVYKCDAKEAPFIVKDRTHIGTQLGTFPMNLAEVLRAAGYDISRLKGLEWQEEFVEGAAQQMIQTGGSRDHQLANDLYRSLIDKGVDFRVARWTLRDAMDRAVIRRGLTAAQKQFIA